MWLRARSKMLVQPWPKLNVVGKLRSELNNFEEDQEFDILTNRG